MTRNELLDGKQNPEPSNSLRMCIITTIELYTMVVGILEKVTKDLDVYFVDFKYGYRFYLNGCNPNFIKRLEQHIGEKIGIQRTEVPGYEYVLRRIVAKKYFDTTKKRNHLNPVFVMQKDKVYSYMRKWRRGIKIDPYKKIKEKTRILSDFYSKEEDEIKR
jgi:hypothetical protein